MYIPMMPNDEIKPFLGCTLVECNNIYIDVNHVHSLTRFRMHRRNIYRKVIEG